MSIASELTNLEGNIGDSYDAVNDMGGVIPAHKNMANLDQAIRTIPQNQGATYTAGNGINIDANNEISIDDTVVAELSDLPGVMTGATSGAAGTSGLVPAPAAGDDTKVLSGAGTWVNQPAVPTVNDATLTIQKNGTSVGTFTANASSNSTVNITTLTAEEIVDTSAITPTVSTAMIQDDAVTRAKINDSDFTSTEDGWAVNYLPNGKKMWSIKGSFTTGYFTVGAGHWGYAQNIATLPTSINSIDDVYVMGWASPSGGSGSTKVAVYNGTLVGGARSFGVVATELYGSGSVTSGGIFSITLIEA